MFADDDACFADTVRILQNPNCLIKECCWESGMCLNMDKSKIMVFRNGGPIKESERWTFNGNLKEDLFINIMEPF